LIVPGERILEKEKEGIEPQKTGASLPGAGKKRKPGGRSGKKQWWIVRVKERKGPNRGAEIG